MPPQIEPAPQDPVFAQSQLLRSISAALAIAGFDSVLPSALEAFRADVEEYMLAFLADVKTSMHASRRTTALPIDFTYALSALSLTSGDLEPHTTLPFPPSLSAPLIAPPRPAEGPPQPYIAPMLGEELNTPAISGSEVKESSYIPAHFPPLPSRHAYLQTSTFTSRESDARKIRERATEEGILAEQALRKLTGARVRGAERGIRGAAVVKAKGREESWREALGDMLQEEGIGAAPAPQDSAMAGLGFGESMTSAFGMDGAGDAKGKDADPLEALVKGGGLSVNHDRGHWRRGAAGAVR